MNRKLIPAIAAVAILATACSSVSTEPDEAGLVYDAGALSSTTFQECVKPGNLTWNGPGDQGFRYPAGQRTFDFSDDLGAESKPLTVVSKDQLTLNTTCDALRKFHEQIGLKYKADIDRDDNGASWAQLLRFYLGKALDQAMDTEARKHEWLQLATDPATKAQWQDAVEAQFKANVATLAGGDYFQGLTLQTNQPQPPASVQKALEDTQKAIQENRAQKEKNEQVTTELQSIKELVGVLGPQGYVLYQALKDGRVTIVPVPTGSAVNITSKAGG